MATNERQQVWFDPDTPGPLHDALRADYAQTKARAEQRPSLRRHMQSCPVCQEIGGATAAAPAPHAGRRRMKLVLTKARMHLALGLPDNFEIVHMYADNDPNVVSVLVAGEGLPETSPDVETPTARLSDLHRDGQSL